MHALGLAAMGLLLVGASATGATAPQQTRTANLRVNAEVVRDCRIQVAPLAFGNYDPVGINRTQPLDASTTIEVTCTRGTISIVFMTLGRYANRIGGSTGSARGMLGPLGRLLEYYLYRDASRTERWGASGLKLAAAPSSAPRVFTVFGRIVPGQDVPVGNYEDEVVVSLRF